MRYASLGLLGTIRSSLLAKFVLVLSAIAILVGALSAVDLATTERSLQIAHRFVMLQKLDQDLYDSIVADTQSAMIAERDILINLNNPSMRDEALERWQESIGKIRHASDTIAQYSANGHDIMPELVRYLENHKTLLKDYSNLVETIVATAQTKPSSNLQMLQAKLFSARVSLSAFRDRMDYYRDLQDDEIKEAAKAMAVQAARARSLVIAISFTFLLAIFGAVLIFPNRITRPLSRLCEATDWLAAGDLTTRVKVDRHDEIGRLAANFNGMANTIEHRTLELEQKNQRLIVAQKRLRKHARRIERMRKNALQANDAKSEFLARMSHEIRTPLAATLGFADLLLDQCDSPEQMRECVRVIQQNGQHLLSIINDILDLSKIEAGKLSAQLAPCPLVSVLAAVSSLMRFKAEEKGLQFRLTFDSPIPERITTDPTRLRQILLNLLNNAIKFTHKGTVELKVKLIQFENNQSFLCCDVRDEGIGMNEQQVQQLFQPFVQVHESNQYGGTGLGLVISHSLAQMLGGDLTVTSTPNYGSTFHLRIATGDLTDIPLVSPNVRPEPVNNLPIPPVTPDAPREIVPGAAPQSSIRVLVAEDTPALLRYMEIILTRAGYACDLVESGPEVLERMAAAKREGRPYTVVLLDLLLPGMDGFEVLHKLQATNDKTPVIALTAHAMRHVQDKCANAGFTDFISKPVDRGALIATIQRLAEARAQ